MNQVVLVGRLTSTPVLEDTGTKKVAIVTLAVARSYKNVDGEYETDFIDVTVWEGVATNMCEYVRQGDLIGVKGRLENVNYFDENEGRNKQKTVVVAEKVTFLSNRGGNN